jgi:hypothetical protein
MTEPSVIIRDYRASDDAACRRCVVELQDAERELDMRLLRGEEMADDYLRQMHVRCDEWAGKILVAELEGEVAGLAMIVTKVPFEQLDVARDLYLREGFVPYSEILWKTL